MSSVVELVVFKTKENTDYAEFMDAVSETDEFIQKCDGFVLRELNYSEETSEWVDIVYWESMEQAKTAGQQFMEHPKCTSFMKLIDPNHMKMWHLNSVKAVEA